MYADEGGRGVRALPCTVCHGAANFATLSAPIKSIPGNPRWHLAPSSMAWQGKSLPEICEQIKDRARNGGHSLAEIHEHMANDPLVAWGWARGEGRVPAPGTQKELGARSSRRGSRPARTVRRNDRHRCPCRSRRQSARSVRGHAVAKLIIEAAKAAPAK
jgi:hypothetical protein